MAVGATAAAAEEEMRVEAGLAEERVVLAEVAVAGEKEEVWAVE